MRSLLRAVIENATVTAAETPASLCVDAFVLRAAEILPYEEVEIVHVATGERFRIFVEAAPEGSGVVSLRAYRAGDRITILSFVMLHDGQTLGHKARVVSLDGENRVVAVAER
jgi:aspartate 1-decarboxylase